MSGIRDEILAALESHDRCPPQARDARRRDNTTRLIMASVAVEMADMATKFRAVNVERLSEQLGADVFAMRERLDAAEVALKKIAAYDDAAASAYLRATGSYTSFDEPGSVEIARTALEGKTDV